MKYAAKIIFILTLFVFLISSVEESNASYKKTGSSCNPGDSACGNYCYYSGPGAFECCKDGSLRSGGACRSPSPPPQSPPSPPPQRSSPPPPQPVYNPPSMEVNSDVSEGQWAKVTCPADEIINSIRAHYYCLDGRSKECNINGVTGQDSASYWFTNLNCGGDPCAYTSKRGKLMANCEPKPQQQTTTSQTVFYRDKPLEPGSWCDKNCYASNTPGSPNDLNCGLGWEQWSTMYCRATLPSGKTCGTCVAQPKCPNGLKETGETCSSCPQDAGCSAGEKCQNSQCVVDNCGNGRIDPGETNLNCPADVTASEICWNGIDDDNNGAIDDRCGGCADVNGDRRVEFTDLFYFGDCAGLSSPSRTCPIGVFDKMDWNDNNIIEASTETRRCGVGGQLCIGDLNGDNVVDLTDFFILSDCTTGKGVGGCNNNVFARSDLDGNGLIDQHEINRIKEASVIRGSDGNCFLQNWGSKLSCSQQTCSFIGIGGECRDNSLCGDVAKCSFGKRQDLSVGHCCPENTWWDDGIKSCTSRDLTSCDSCTKYLMQNGKFNPSFFTDKNCFDPARDRICVKSNFYSREEKPFIIEVIKR